MREQDFTLIAAHLLREAKAADVPADDVPRIVCTPPTPQPPANLVEFLGSLTEDEGLRWGRILSSTEAAHAIAAHYELDYADVHKTMNGMSESLWCLLDSAEGWTVLGEQITWAIQGRLDAPLLKTSIH